MHVERVDGSFLRYFSCPVLWLSNEVLELIKIIDYYDEFPGAMRFSYGEVSQKFIQCRSYFKKWIAIYHADKSKKASGAPGFKKTFNEVRK